MSSFSIKNGKIVKQSNSTISMTTRAPIKLEWIDRIDESIHLGIIDLLNEVATNERNMGYNEPLTEDHAAALWGSLETDCVDGAVMIARDGKHIVGTVTLSPNKLPARRHIIEIKRCVITSSYQGTILLSAWQMIQEKCQEMGWRVIVIDVRTDHAPTLKLWRKLGFVEFGRLPCYAIMDGREIDGVFMYMLLQR